MAEPVQGPATTADSTALLDFWRRAAEDTDRPDDTEAALETLLRRDPDALIVARLDGAIVGTVIVGWDGWRCHLYRLAVDPGRRGEGVARALLVAAEDRARRHGAIRLDAMVLDDNLLAHHVWSRLGYHRQRQWSRWVKPLD